MTDANGKASLTLTVPKSAKLTVFCQWAVLVSPLQVTQGLPLTIVR